MGLEAVLPGPQNALYAMLCYKYVPYGFLLVYSNFVRPFKVKILPPLVFWIYSTSKMPRS